jgi:hypothetical protein
MVEVELTDDELRAARDYNSDLISVSERHFNYVADNFSTDKLE